MDHTKEIEEVLSSLKGIERAEANPFLYEKVMLRLKKNEPVTNSDMSVKIVFATIALLIAVNAFTIYKTQTNSSTNSGQIATKDSYGLNNSYSY